MDKYEYNLKLDQMKALFDEEKYSEAADIADTINWNKVKNVNALVKAGEIYEKVERYEDSKEILLLAYDRSPIGRMIIYRLAEVALKMGNTTLAQEYYEEFVEIAPHDSRKYILKYNIKKAQQADYDELISILEDLKEQEYSEEWAYELAYLYHKAGASEKCIEACDELILWFGDGPYVERALELKMLYQPLTKQQEEKYRLFKQQKEGITHIGAEEMEKAGEFIHDAVTIPQVSLSPERFNTVNLQQEIAKGMQQILDATEQETVSDTMDNIKKIVEEIPYLQLPREEEKPEEEVHIETDEEIDGDLKVNFQEMIGEDADGQMSLMMSNRTYLERQITGQLSIDEVLEEWEKTKRAAEYALQEAEMRKLESAKARALQEAGDIMDRLADVIPRLDAGVTPRELLEEEYLGRDGEKNIGAEELFADMNDMLGKEIERLSNENAYFDEQIAKASAQNEKVKDIAKELNEVPLPEKIEVPVTEIEDVENVEGASEEPLEEIEIEEISFDPNVNEAEAIEAAAAKVEKEFELPEITLDEEELKEILREQEESEELGDAEEVEISEVSIDPEEFEIPEVTVDLEELEISETSVDSEELEVPEETVDAEEIEIPEVTVDAEEIEVPEENVDTEEVEVPEETVDTEEVEVPEETVDTEEVEVPEETIDTEEVEVPEETVDSEDVKDSELVSEQEETKVYKEPKISDDVQDLIQKSVTKRMPEVGAIERECKRMEEELGEEKAITHLTDELKSVFSYFVPVKGMEDQLCQALTGVSRHLNSEETAGTGNLIIQGGHGCGKTVLAASVIKALQKTTGYPGGKVGKIYGEALNKKDIRQLLNKVSGGCLIIESAGNITRQTAITLSLLLEQDASGILIILEDTSKGIKKALSLDDGFAKKFTEKISVPIFTNDELVSFAQSYSNELGYEIEEMGILALYNRISNIQKLDQATTLTEVKEIVDEAIKNESRGGIKKAFSILAAKRYNSEDRIILRERDFEG